MKLILTIILLTSIMVITPVLASDVYLKTTQSEYTFIAGDEAQVPITIESTFPAINVGTLAYTLTRKEEQGGFSYTQSNTESQSFPISPGSSQNTITLNSQDPAEYEVTLSLQYRDDGKDYSADLPPFLVHFISNQTPPDQSSGQNSGQGSGSGGSPLTSTSSEVKQNPSAQGQDPLEEMEQQMNAMHQQNQQMLQQALSGQGIQSSQQQPQNARQALQNNQMNTQSTALQRQMAEEAEQKKKDQQELSENLDKDPLMIKMLKTLNQAGYQKKNISVTAQGKGFGSLSGLFENQAGHQVQIQGEIQNGSIKQGTLKW